MALSSRRQVTLLFLAIGQLVADLSRIRVLIDREVVRQGGKHCFGTTPMQRFLDGIPLAKEKVFDQTLQTPADVV